MGEKLVPNWSILCLSIAAANQYNVIKQSKGHIHLTSREFDCNNTNHIRTSVQGNYDYFRLYNYLHDMWVMLTAHEQAFGT